MRKSARIQSSSASLSKLSLDLIGDDDEDVKVEEVFDISNTEENEDLEMPDTNNSNSRSKRGRPRKRKSEGVTEEQKPVYYENKTDKFKSSDEEEEASELESVKNSRNIKSTPSISKSRSKRIGTYVPPLENPAGIDDALLSSRKNWEIFLKSRNESIKRKNRLLRTNMTKSSSVSQPSFNVNYSSFKCLQDDQASPKLLLKIINKTETIDFKDQDLYIDGKTAILNTDKSVLSICYCGCESCKRSGSEFLIFVASLLEVLIFSTRVAAIEGIQSLKQVGRIVFPSKEVFNSMCMVGHNLSICTNSNIYFLNCNGIHVVTASQGAFILQLDSSTAALFPNQELSILTHSWKGKYIAVGTSSSEIYVFNVDLKEIYRISLPTESIVNSLDWSDDFTILISGNFPKLYSIDLRDPFVIETQVSSLSPFPQVRWSPFHSAILFADCENHARIMDKSDKEMSNRLHHPIGTFDSMVLDISTSPNHNIIATACSSGSIQISWMPHEHGHGVEFEKRIFSLNLADESNNNESSVQISPASFTSQKHDSIRLYPSLQACTAVSWCPHEAFPGILAAGFRNGLLVLIATDRFFI